jgi:hypothetical protein
MGQHTRGPGHGRGGRHPRHPGGEAASSASSQRAAAGAAAGRGELRGAADGHRDRAPPRMASTRGAARGAPLLRRKGRVRFDPVIRVREIASRISGRQLVDADPRVREGGAENFSKLIKLLVTCKMTSLESVLEFILAVHRPQVRWGDAESPRSLVCSIQAQVEALIQELHASGSALVVPGGVRLRSAAHLQILEDLRGGLSQISQVVASAESKAAAAQTCALRLALWAIRHSHNQCKQ